MKSLSLRILQLFGEMRKDRLDLHALFEAAGNEPDARRGVLDAIDALIHADMLDACGNDFYMLTERGNRAILNSTHMDLNSSADLTVDSQWNESNSYGHSRPRRN